MFIAKKRAGIAALFCLVTACAASEYLDRSAKTTDSIDKEAKVEQVPVKGFNVVVQRPERKDVKGELLAVDEKFIWVDLKWDVAKIPIQSVSKVTVELYPAAGAGGIAGWTVLGTLSTISHGAFLIFSAPIWVIVGTATAVSAATSNDLKVTKPENVVHLYQFARYPQGWPTAAEEQKAEQSASNEGSSADGGLDTDDASVGSSKL